MRHSQRAFTLIELLVVIAIIGLLSSVVLASLNTARVKARDATRVADVEQIRNALVLYQNDNNGNYPPTDGCLYGWCCLGAGDTGTCWAQQYHGSTALDNALRPYLPVIPDDPLNNTATFGDAFMYRVDSGVADIHWGIEKTSGITSADCAGGVPGQWGGGAGNGASYYCQLFIQ